MRIGERDMGRLVAVILLVLSSLIALSQLAGVKQLRLPQSFSVTVYSLVMTLLTLSYLLVGKEKLAIRIPSALDRVLFAGQLGIVIAIVLEALLGGLWPVRPLSFFVLTALLSLFIIIRINFSQSSSTGLVIWIVILGALLNFSEQALTPGVIGVDGWRDLANSMLITNSGHYVPTTFLQQPFQSWLPSNNLLVSLSGMIADVPLLVVQKYVLSGIQLLAIPAIYLVVSKLVGERRVGLIAALFFALLPFYFAVDLFAIASTLDIAMVATFFLVLFQSVEGSRFNTVALLLLSIVIVPLSFAPAVVLVTILAAIGSTQAKHQRKIRAMLTVLTSYLVVYVVYTSGFTLVLDTLHFVIETGLPSAASVASSGPSQTTYLQAFLLGAGLLAILELTTHRDRLLKMTPGSLPAVTWCWGLSAFAIVASSIGFATDPQRYIGLVSNFFLIVSAAAGTFILIQNASRKYMSAIVLLSLVLFSFLAISSPTLAPELNPSQTRIWLTNSEMAPVSFIGQFDRAPVLVVADFPYLAAEAKSYLSIHSTHAFALFDYPSTAPYYQETGFYQFTIYVERNYVVTSNTLRATSFLIIAVANGGPAVDKSYDDGSSALFLKS